MPSVGDVYQIIDRQTLFGQQVLNVYYWRLTATPGGFTGAEDVAEAYDDQILPLVRAFQTEDVTHTAIEVKNLFDETDAFTKLVSVVGGNGTDSLGSFEAIPFTLEGDNASVRPGAKRYAGVSEANVADGVITAAGALTALAALAAGLIDPMTFGALSVSFLEHVIVKRIADGTSYRLPANAGEAVLSVVTDALFDPLVTSQTSRKVGRGD